MPTIIRNDTVSKSVLQLEFAGSISLQPNEIAKVLAWVKSSPIADHILVKFANMHAVTGDCVTGGIIEAYVAHEETVRALHIARRETINKTDEVLNAGNNVSTR